MMGEERQIKAGWAVVLGKGVVFVEGLTPEPITLSPDEARALAALDEYARMAESATMVAQWLAENGCTEEQIATMMADLGSRAQKEQAMHAFISAFGIR